MRNEWSAMKKLIWLKRAVLSAASAILKTITGLAPLLLGNAVAHPIHALTQYGKCTQSGTPTPDAPVDIVCNNGAIKLRRPSGMPIAYQMVEWLKPAGSIPITGFKTKSTQEIETVFYREQRGASYLYSSDTATSGTTNTTAYLTTGAGNWRWDGKSYSVSVSAGIKITSVQNEKGVWLNGTQYGYYTNAGDFVSTNDLRLSSGENTTVRIYSMTIREGETVTLDLVPVQRVTDNAYGFYDKVSGNFYTNAEATFTAGDPIPDPVETYTDGEDEVLTVSGVNLLDPSTSNIKIGQQVTADGVITSVYPNNWRSDYIPVVGGKTYAFWGRKKADNTISAYNRINWYTEDKTHIPPRPSYTVDTVTVGTAPSNAAFAMLSCSPFKIGDAITREQFDLYNWMFAEASAEIPYEPYVTPQTASVPMLLGVGNYKDEVELVGGLLTHKVGMYVITGDESGWGTSSTAGIYTLAVGFGKGLVAICTHFAKVSNATSAANMSDGTFKGHSTNTVVYFKDSSAETLDAFKAKARSAYASGNPWVIVYALATETTEQTTAQHLVTHEGTNIVDVTSNVDPVELKAEYYATE